MRKVGIIGTGLMGSAIARRLISKGYEVLGFNRTRSKVEELAPIGVKVAETPRQVAESSDVVLTILKDAVALESVMFGEGGIAYSARKNVVVANVSTISPSEAVRISSRLEREGIVMLDTPVMGGPPLAERGMLVILVSGSGQHYELIKDVLDAIASKIFYIGGQGKANALKLALNLQVALTAVAVSEGIVLAKASGVDPSTFVEVLNSTEYRTGLSERKGPKMVQGKFEKTFALDMMLKDLRLINETAKELSVVLPFASLAEQIYRAAGKRYGDLDYTAILAFIEMLNMVT
ncbi:MAG: NAD(P)-dependent oxidoreductase [Nitrososphaerota archaeon]|nr:NAD(P)-dependent oxidoreductase [Aigarchaeota archaeon]MDW8076461.1 NAD(P)-dependent oxidoreductase [Nitrososphaerota archaeon]